MQHELDDLRAQVLEIPALRKHFNSLTKEHAESKQRRQQVAADLRAELATSKTSLVERTAALTQAEARVAALEADIGEERSRSNEATRRHEAREAESRQLLADLDAAAHAIASTRADITTADLRDLDDHIHSSHLRTLRLQRQVADRDAQSSALIELVTDLEADRDSWRAQAEELDEELAIVRSSAAGDRSEAAKARREAERDAALARLRLDESQAELEEAKRRKAVDSNTSTLLLHAADARLAVTADELTDVRSSLHTSEVEVASLVKRLATAEASLAQAAHDLEATKAELEDTREDRDDALRAKGKAEASLVEASEARQRLTGLLTQSRAAEAALEEELARCVVQFLCCFAFVGA